MIPQQAQPPGARRGGTPGWLLGVGGVVLASAAWGGALFATGVVGGGEDSPDLAGYRFAADLCDTADMTAFETDYDPSGTGPRSLSAQDEALDLSSCEFSLEPAGASSDDYSSFYITYEIAWHKATDPEPEFAASVGAFEQYTDSDGYHDYRTEPLTDLGEEAYIIYGDNAESGDLSLVTLMLRDGWFEYALTWNAYVDVDASGPEDRDQVRDLLVSATRSTLDELRGEARDPNSV
jgi:hypothetical protein